MMFVPCVPGSGGLPHNEELEREREALVKLGMHGIRFLTYVIRRSLQNGEL